MSNAGHMLGEWQKEGYTQVEALHFLTLIKKPEYGKITMRKQGTSSEAGFLVPLINHSTSHLLMKIKMACLPFQAGSGLCLHQSSSPHYRGKN